MNRRNFCVPTMVSRFAFVLAIAVLLTSRPICAQQAQDPSTPTNTVNSPGPTPASSPGGEASIELSDPNHTPGETADSPVTVNLETGLPLRTVMSPVHWGHFSVFSASMVGVYDSNYLQSLTPQSAQETFVSGLFVYALRRRRTQLDLQYMPMGWAAAGKVQHDFMNNAVDAFTSFGLSRHWSLSIHETFRDSPQQFAWTTPAFSPDFLTATATKNPFLLTGQNSLMNNASVALNGHISEKNTLSFSYNEGYIRLSPQANAPPASIYSVRSEQNISAFSAGWNRNLTRRNSIFVTLGFQRMYEHNLGRSSEFETVSLGYTRILRPTLTVTLEGGPEWSNVHGGLEASARTRTAQGSVSLFKSFREGGIAATVSRSNSFVGVISNYNNNRYDLSVTRKFFRRWNTQLGYSYVQQELLTRKKLNSGVAYASLAYGLTRNWEVFSGYYYFTFTGSQVPYSRRNVMGAGIRWAWTPRSQGQ